MPVEEDKSRDASVRDGHGGIQSLDAALRVLEVLSEAGQALPLSELARLCGMPPTKVHRYLASFAHAGLVQQNGRSGSYDLGNGAIALGLSAMARHDFVNAVSDAMPDLTAETGLTALLCVWGNRGPTVVRWERAASFIVTSLGLGTTLPVLSSATGRVCLAFLPETVTGALVAEELRKATKRPRVVSDIETTRSGIQALAESVRTRGCATVDGRFIPGLVAISAPILDWQGQAQAAVTLIGTDPATIEPGSDAETTLLGFCAAHSITEPTGR